MNMKKFVFFTGIYNVMMGVSFFIPGYMELLGFNLPESGYWSFNLGFFVMFVGFLLIFCSRDLESRASIVYLNSFLRLTGFFLLAGYGFFGNLGIVAGLAGILDLIIGVVFFLGLPASQKKSHMDMLLDKRMS